MTHAFTEFKSSALVKSVASWRSQTLAVSDAVGPVCRRQLRSVSSIGMWRPWTDYRPPAARNALDWYLEVG
jgi:hypothetical protein